MRSINGEGFSVRGRDPRPQRRHRSVPQTGRRRAVDACSGPRANARHPCLAARRWRFGATDDESNGWCCSPAKSPGPLSMEATTTSTTSDTSRNSESCVASLLRETYAVVGAAARTTRAERERQAAMYLEWALETRRESQATLAESNGTSSWSRRKRVTSFQGCSKVGRVLRSTLSSGQGQVSERRQRERETGDGCERDVEATRLVGGEASARYVRRRRSRSAGDSDRCSSETDVSSSTSADRSALDFRSQPSSDSESEVEGRLFQALNWAQKASAVANCSGAVASTTQALGRFRAPHDAPRQSESLAEGPAQTALVSDGLGDGVAAQPVPTVAGSIPVAVGHPLQWLAHRRHLPGLNTAPPVDALEEESARTTAPKRPDWLLASFCDHGSGALAGRSSETRLRR